LAVSGQRDEAWFNDLCQRYEGRLLRDARRLLQSRNECDAEDVVQRTLMTAWRKRTRVPDEEPMGWLYKTLFNHVKQWREENSSAPVSITDEVAQGLVARGGEFELVERAQDLLVAWAKLSDDERQLLTMCSDGTGRAAAAEAMRLRPDVLRKRLERVRQRLRELLDLNGRASDNVSTQSGRGRDGTA
jgi:RNA polymerase sigma factor (sigma-70 family)